MPAYLGFGIICRIVCHVYASDVLPNSRGTRASRLLGVRIYLNNYFAINKCLTHSRLHVEIASPAYLGFGVNLTIIFACIHV